MTINPLLLAGIILAVLIIAGLIGWLVNTRVRSQMLKRRFGPEYDYTLDQMGDRTSAEAELKEREKRVVQLDLHDLDDHDKERYHGEWTEIQASFVDDPVKAVERGNRLITEVMIARGFPVSDFDQRAADLSVLYPKFVPSYREANEIAKKNQEGTASTEDLRQAMVNYHSLFDQLLGTMHPVKPVEEVNTEPEKTTEKAGEMESKQ